MSNSGWDITWASLAAEQTDHEGDRGCSSVGVLAAIANAVYHATGKPVRDLPTTGDKLHHQRKWPRRKEKFMKILMVLTSHDKLGDTGRKTGFWLEEFAAPYFTFKDAGVEIVIASPKGGQPPLDPKSNEPNFQTDLTHRFEADADAKARLATTVRLDSVKAEDFDTVFYAGGHGPMWDLAEDQNSIKLIETMFRAGKPVALVCHAPGVLRHVKTPDGKPLVQGKTATGFTRFRCHEPPLGILQLTAAKKPVMVALVVARPETQTASLRGNAPASNRFNSAVGPSPDPFVALLAPPALSGGAPTPRAPSTSVEEAEWLSSPCLRL